MKTWFESLEARERLFVGIGAVISVVTLFWFLIWQPLDKGHAELTRNVATWERALSEVRPLKGLVGSAAPTQTRTNPTAQQSPVIIVDTTLRARGLDRSLKRSQPTTSTGIKVDFENVAFDDLMLWLGDLSNQHDMHVQAGSFSTSSQAGPGRINASLTIERQP